MAKRFPAHRVKRHRVYTAWEASEVLGCHRQTVLRWVNERGLRADKTQKPWLIEGDVLKEFLGARQAWKSKKAALHELYCFGCKTLREPAARMAEYVHETSSGGLLKALCPECTTVMNKKVRRADLDEIKAKLDVTIQQASPRLVSPEELRSEVTFLEEGQPHAKAQ